MKFSKMHGIGNDYIYVNCLEQPVQQPEKVAKFVSDRHFGIGSDGLILIQPSQKADFEMAMYNADGSRGEMCGNAIRCVAKYVYDRHLTDKTSIRIETLAGIKEADLVIADGKVVRVRVNMGKPELEPEKIPVRYPQPGTATSQDTSNRSAQAVTSRSPQDLHQIVDCPVSVDGKEYRMTCVSMGNPHCVVFMDAIQGLELEKIGPRFEHHSCFPNRINTEFVKVLDRHTVQMRVWERGSGETLACGTGACAVTVACILNGFTDHQVTVKLTGGDLEIEWDTQTGIVFMTGAAEHVFDGEIDLQTVFHNSL